MGYDLVDWEKSFIKDRKSLIEAENWDEFFRELREENYDDDCGMIYCFLYFDVGIDLLHKMTYIPNYSFQSVLLPKRNLVIPKNIEYIGECAFENTDLISIKILGEVSRISYCCFDGCRSLEKVILPSSVKNIGEHAFQCCEKLTHIDLSNVEYINTSAFRECGSLSSVDLSRCKGIEKQAFEYSGLKKIAVPRKCTVGNNAFPEKCEIIMV